MALVYYPPLNQDVVTREKRVTEVWRNYFQTLSASITPGAGSITQLTGPVTTPAGGGVQAATITPLAVTTGTLADDAVTYAKMQNVSAASRLLGRGSAAGAGNVEELTLGTGLTLTGTSLATTGLVLQVQALTLTHANIQAMFATPIAVVAAQGTGTVIVPVFAVMTFNTTAGAYTLGGDVGFYWNSVAPALMTWPVAGLTAAASQVALGTLVVGALATQANGVNQALTISNATAAFATGNAANTADVVLGYYVATP